MVHITAVPQRTYPDAKGGDDVGDAVIGVGDDANGDAAEDSVGVVWLAKGFEDGYEVGLGCVAFFAGETVE